MELNLLLDDVIDDTMVSLPAFGPEITLCVTIFLILGFRVVTDKVDTFWIALLGAIFALLMPWTWFLQAESPMQILAGGGVGAERLEIFSGMLVYDAFTVFIRAVLMLFAVLFIILTKLTKIPDRLDGPDVYTLVLGSTLGMCLMASANHLLVIFLAVEMASVPSYVLAGMLKTKRKSSEAALKYSVFGAGAAGVMLYGISLVAGVTNSCHLPTIAQALATDLPSEHITVLSLAGLMIMVGLAFKLSAVPFHFWCPDVFEGATAEVNAFLSVASKAAALALLVRVAFGFGVIPETPTAPAHGSVEQRAFFSVEDEKADASENEAAEPDEGEPIEQTEEQKQDAKEAHIAAGRDLTSVRSFMALLIAFVAIITCTFGNLAAYGQTNIKRLLAYSTIAHAGYMMMAVPPALALIGHDNGLAEKAIAALAIYIAIYLFMNLGAFAIVAFLRNTLKSEEIDDYAGLIKHSPGVVVCFAILLFSLIGLPPLAGFVGKFAIFAALTEGWLVTGNAYLMVLLVVGGINTAISLFYYLRVVKVMVMDPEPEGRAPASLSLVSMAGAYIVVVTAPILILFVSWNGLNEWALAAARQLLS